MASNSNSSVATVVGIGEVLWDILPHGKLPGGAPANVVFHCGQLGVDSYLVSELGDDDLGDEMRGVLRDIGFKPDFLNTFEGYPTGTVSVSLDHCQSPRYEIQKNVAWDYIRWSPQLEGLARKSDAVFFGALAQRSARSRETIGRFLDCTAPDCLRVFDVNLRQPYPDSAVLLTSLEKASVLKLNTEELDYLSNLLALKGDMGSRVAEIVRMFNLSCAALTRGEQGSILVTGDETADCPGLEINVQDTVGAGDAFTAAMVVGFLRNRPLREINAAACRAAAFVCSKAGAMVKLPFDVVRDIQVPEI